MAHKRMFSRTIVDSDAFLDMPMSAQALYFHLGMVADDDGFVGNPRRVLRNVGGNDDDMKVLISKRFLLAFDSGIVVIKHHRINNNWDSANCKRTVYLEEFEKLYIKQNRAYTLDISQGKPLQSAFRLKTDWKQSLEENRLEENRIEETTTVRKKRTTKKTPKKVEENVPFIWEEELKKLDDSPQKHIQIIAFFFRVKKLRFDNNEQLQTAMKRHMRPARSLVGFTEKDLNRAIDVAEDKYADVQWTLETLVKILTS